MKVHRYTVLVLVLVVVGNVASLLPPQILETYPGYKEDRDILDIIHDGRSSPRPSSDSSEDFVNSGANETDDGIPLKLARQFLGSWFYPADATFSREAQQDMKELLLTENIASNWVEYEQLIKSRFLDQWRYLQKTLSRNRLRAPSRNQVWNLRRALSRVYYHYRTHINRDLKKAKIQFHQRTLQSKFKDNELVELQKTMLLNLKANVDRADVEFKAKIDKIAGEQQETLAGTSTTDKPTITSTSPRTLVSQTKQLPPEKQKPQQPVSASTTPTVNVIREAVAEEPRPCDATCQSKCEAIVSNLRLEIK